MAHFKKRFSNLTFSFVSKNYLFRHFLLFLSYTLICIILYYAYDAIPLFGDRDAHIQLVISRSLVLLMLFHSIGVITIKYEQVKTTLVNYFQESGSAYNLAIFRIIFFFLLGGHFLFYAIQHQISWTYLPDSSRVGLPLINWLVYNLPITPEIYTVCSILAGIACWCICLGITTRHAFKVLIPTAFYVIGVPMFYGKLSHYHILFWVPVLFYFSPVADVWSIDAWLLRRKTGPLIIENHPKYILAFKFLWIQLAIIYFFAGIVKLWDCGLDWALGSNMINQMRWEWVEHYDKVPKLRLDNYPVIAHICGIMVIWFEVFYVLLIVKPNVRIWAFISAYLFHLLCGYFMYIDFSTLRWVALSYIPWDRIAGRLIKSIKLSENRIPVNIGTLFKDKNYYYAFLSSSILLIINFSFSAFRVHSYPFSSYPTYSSIVPDRIKTVEMVAYDAKHQPVAVKELGKKAKFRWENIRPYEMRISECYERKDESNLKLKLNEYWLIWKNSVPGLNHVKHVDMYLITSSISPEKRNEVIEKTYLGDLNL